MKRWLASFFEAGTAQSSARLVAVGCLLGMLGLVIGALVLAIGYAWRVATQQDAHDPSAAIAALGSPMIGLAGAAWGALKERDRVPPTGTPDAAPEAAR